MPLMLLGGINRLDTMEHAMAAGFDFVAMGRALLREPDLVTRLQSGATDAGICIHCNRACRRSTPAPAARCGTPL